MPVPWGKVFDVLKIVYVLFVKGRTVKMPGGGEFTFPSQKPGIGDTVDPRPKIMGFAAIPTPQPPSPPLSVQTLGFVLFVVFGLPIVALVLLGVVEWRTLADDVPDNHITATLRIAFKKQPGAVFLGTLVWVVFLVSVFWGIAGHVFFQ